MIIDEKNAPVPDASQGDPPATPPASDEPTPATVAREEYLEALGKTSVQADCVWPHFHHGRPPTTKRKV